ncbi:hypothetical protein VTG60DRAFT_4754 [Thermothelomyces hinnuleus]
MPVRQRTVLDRGQGSSGAGSKESLTAIARSMVEDMMSFYPGNRPGGVPGLLPKPYYWWEGGTLMGSLIDYWYYTGDTRWNGVAQDGLLFQTGPDNDYMPPNQTMTEGNDDQGFWGMAVMSAAELNFEDPPHGRPQWLALAQAIFPWNNGYDYKNSISQACFFNIAARLALYTGNQSYADWADRVRDWMAATKLLNPETYHIYDGIHIENCSRITPYQWTYNAGAMLLGAAALYNHSASAARRETWRERVDGLLNDSLIFFTGEHGDIMTEMAATTKWAPWTHDGVKHLLASSAAAAVATCTGGDNGRMCGLKWNTRRWDGTTGVGQQMAAMEVVLANAIEHSRPPVTDRNGGTSVGDPGAGGADVGRKTREELSSVSTAEKTGAYILTVLFVIGVIAGSLFALDDEYDRSSVPERLARLRAVVVSGVRSWSCSVVTGRSRPSEGKMTTLALVVLSVPLSIWAVERAYSWLIADNSSPRASSYLLFAGVAFVALKTSLSLVDSYRFERRRRALGCGTVASFPHKDPILGLDAFVKTLRAVGGHALFDLYSRRFASCGNTYYILTLGQRLLMTNEVENVKAMLGPKMDDWPIGGPRLLAVLPVLGPDSIFSSNGGAWQEARALLRPSFVRDQYANLRCFARHTDNMLAAVPADGTTFDMQSLLLDMTMDSSTDFLLGRSTNLLTQASPEAQQFARDFEYASRESAKMAFLGELMYHLPHPRLKRAARGLREYVRSYLEKAVAEKKKEEEKGEESGEGASDRGYVFLYEMLKANPPEEYIVDQILSVLIAGRDTTATAMSSVFYFLARNARAVEKLRQEIKRA